VDPRDFRSLASLLVTGTSTVLAAARLRTSTSRAYYSVYHVGTEILEDMGFYVDKGPSGHAQVSMCLSNSGNDELKKAGSQLSDLYGYRVTADYRLHNARAENQKNVQADVLLAGKLIKTLDQVSRGPDRSQIVQAIQQWQRVYRGRS